MATFQRGSKGPEVKQIQQKLKDLGLYLGIVDGDFGGGTESAIIQFKKSRNLGVDGKVDGQTWGTLFPEQPVIPNPTVTGKKLLDRCLELTGGFETNLPPPGCYAMVTGNFDGMGISFGALQWNLGQGSLQTLFSKIEQQYPNLVGEVFHEHATEWRAVLKKPKTQQLAWAKSIQTPKNQLFDPWKGLFKAIGQRQECQEVECDFVKDVFNKALQLCITYKLRSERAVALFFDIITQNGSIDPAVQQLIEKDFKNHPATGSIEVDEPIQLAIVANRRADAANPKWQEDVRKRKLTIANGQGVVHGSHYNLAEQYAIKLVPAEGL
jgi:hypothetical protein